MDEGSDSEPIPVKDRTIVERTSERELVELLLEGGVKSGTGVVSEKTADATAKTMDKFKTAA